MKKTIGLLLVCCFILPLFVFGESAELEDAKFTFRNGIKWGMTREEVISIEGKPPDATNASTIQYNNEKVRDLKTILIYAFNTENKLKSINYHFEEIYLNPDKYIIDYENIKKSLTDKYGEPIYNFEEWTSDIYKKTYEESKGLGLIMEAVTFGTQYDLQDTTIMLHMKSDSFEISTVLLYLSEEHQEDAPAEDNNL